jgi:hypothetical protein
LVEEFETEHSVIIDTFKNIKALGVHSEKCHDAILSVEKYILTHLRKEDE